MCSVLSVLSWTRSLEFSRGAGCQHDCRNPSLCMLNEQIVYFHLQCTILKEERKKKREKKNPLQIRTTYSLTAKISQLYKRKTGRLKLRLIFCLLCAVYSNTEEA